MFYHTQFEPDPEHYNGSDLPPYILEGSVEATKFEAGEYEGSIPSPNASRLKVEEVEEWGPHDAAGEGNLDKLLEIAKNDMSALHMEDHNGWQPIHEAARGGHLEIVEFLAAQGADINARTTSNGISVLELVEDFWGQDHPLYEFLYELGALESEQDL